MGRLQGRVAVVTGGGDGIGAAICRRFGTEGASVVVADRKRASAEAVAESVTEAGGTAMPLEADVGVKGEVVAMVAAAVERFGSLDILVNNAWGGGALGRLEAKTDELLLHGMRVGYLGPFWAMQAAFPTMRAQRRGRIINLCSLNGVNAHVGTAEYNCAKEALRALTRTAAREWAPYGITVNALCPAAKTAAFRSLAERQPDLAARADASNPMGRLGDPDDDIAPVAVFLASDDACYLTGNTLFVDGGSHINGVAWAPELPP